MWVNVLLLDIRILRLDHLVQKGLFPLVFEVLHFKAVLYTPFTVVYILISA